MPETSADRIAAAVFFDPALPTPSAKLPSDRIAAVWRAALREEPRAEDVPIAA